MKAASGRLFSVSDLWVAAMNQVEHAVRSDGLGSLVWHRARSLPATMVVCVGMAATLALADGHDQQRMWQLAIFAVLAPLLLLRGGLSGLLAGATQRALRWSLAGFFLCGAVSCLLAFSLRRAALEEAMLLMLLLVSIGMAREIARDRKAGVMFVLLACAAAAAVYALKVSVQYLAALANHLQPDFFTVTPGFSNYRFFNHVQTVALPLLVLLCLLVKSRSARYGACALASVWWGLLFLTAGRGTMVGIAAACLAVLVLRRKHGFAFCRMLGLTACGGLAVYALLSTVLPTLAGLDPMGVMSGLAQRSAADPTSLRLPLWTRGLELIAAHPLFGVGPMHYGHYAIDLQNGAHPHDWLIQFGAEWGIFGLVFLCGAIGFAIRALMRTAPLLAAGDSDDQQMLAAWIAIGAAILVDGLVSGLFVMPMSQLWIALYLGCAAGWTMSFQRAPAGEAGARATAGVLILLMALAGIAVGVAPELSKIVRQVPRTAEEAALYNGYDHPRIWLGGYF